MNNQVPSPRESLDGVNILAARPWYRFWQALTGLSNITINLLPSAAPNPPGNGWSLYVDSGDGNKLKAIAPNGTIVTLGTP